MTPLWISVLSDEELIETIAAYEYWEARDVITTERNWLPELKAEQIRRTDS